ncbi:MAG: HD domain-containing protein [Deltaproteobacteria bacterium]|uniref:HD-GYP domain-containing protein n=1 Tax=Candidatus Deferrimicrobium sp. TaxID=3060586 RepID=UPI00272BF973|nr:HD domain-containing phosphohydrolase [Candidatus Deferrimicrobium sp.]MCR4308899.1 HD domain-containing protein [Deltaproteobacteria bacterium]
MEGRLPAPGMTSLPINFRSLRRAGVVALVVFAVASAHFVTPAGLHGWHWVHILLQKLFYLPILMAASWFGLRGTLLTAGTVSSVFMVHVLRDWGGYRMAQADQVGEIASFWVIALASSLLFDRERRALAETAAAHEETLAALASSLDLREHETSLHSRRVREYTLLLAERLGIKGEEALTNIGTGALLHDVGKIGVPDSILLKKGVPTEEEWERIRLHPELGASLIGPIRFLETAREIVLAHHEKFDGTGYPRGLAGESIPLGARIFAVVDVFDALTTDRPYKAALSYGSATDYLASGRGSHFDPDVVDAFLKIPYRDLAETAARNGVVLISS